LAAAQQPVAASSRQQQQQQQLGMLKYAPEGSYVGAVTVTAVTEKVWAHSLFAEWGFFTLKENLEKQSFIISQLDGYS